MLKLLLCLVCGSILGLMTLQLRQQQLELRHRAASLHREIEGIQSRLWHQQLQVSIETAPNVVARSLKERDLGLVPEVRLPAGAAEWINSDRPGNEAVTQRK